MADEREGEAPVVPRPADLMFVLGMESAAMLLDEEVYSANKLIEEAAAKGDSHAKMRMWAILDAMQVMARSVRHFASDATWRASVMGEPASATLHLRVAELEGQVRELNPGLLPASAPKMLMQLPPPSELETLTVERDNLRRCVEWYANGEHFTLEDWDSVSGEPENWLCPPSTVEGEEPTKPGTWTPDAPPPKRLTVDVSFPWLVEDGGIARAVLAGGQMNTDPNDEEIIVHAAPKSSPPKVSRPSCRDVPPGNGYCDMCAAGHYERCRYAGSASEERKI